MSSFLKKNSVIKEKIFISDKESGIKCYLIPKKDYINKECAIVFFYGANDMNFDDNGKIYNSQSGTAHFIEHKLFANPEGDVFTLFSKNGASANAFTDFEKTVYYFNSSENFYDNVKILINMVKTPYFTEENVNSEKSIIKQEITMYDDNADWRVYYEMLNIMYYNHSIKNKIAGTCDTVEKIDENMLNKCYNSFYTADNMAVICAGDFDENELFDLIKNEFKGFNSKKQVKSVYDDEPCDIVQKYSMVQMDIKETVFSVGFKLPKSFFESDLKTSFALKIGGDILFGESSEFYENLYNKGILKESLGIDFVSGKEFAFFVITGKCENPEDIAELIAEKFKQVQRNGLSSEVFERIKEKHKGKFIRGLNSVDAIVMAQINFAVKNTDISEVYDAISDIDINFVSGVLNKGFDSKNMVLSVVKPLE